MQEMSGICRCGFDCPLVQNTTNWAAAPVAVVCEFHLWRHGVPQGHFRSPFISPLYVLSASNNKGSRRLCIKICVLAEMGECYNISYSAFVMPMPTAGARAEVGHSSLPAMYP